MTIDVDGALRESAIRMEGVGIHPYRLPLVRDWLTHRGRMTVREGWLIRVAAGRAVGVGDCAPLPEAGTEMADAALRVLEHWCREASGTRLRDLWSDLDALQSTPAARFAIESAILDLLARTQGTSLRHLLADVPRDIVRVNASLGGLDAGLPARVTDVLAEGFDVLKLKVGLDDPNVELSAVLALLEKLPRHVSVRLDANGAWTPAQAAAWIEALPAERIDGVEEPLAEPDLDALTELQRGTSIPIAVDESLARLDIDRLFDVRPIRRIVVKPAVVGGVLPAMRLARRAGQAGLETVITSTLDSPAGLLAALQLAAALPGDTAHGLATASLFRDAAAALPVPANGIIRLPGGAGLGLDPEQLLAVLAPSG